MTLDTIERDLARRHLEIRHVGATVLYAFGTLSDGQYNGRRGVIYFSEAGSSCAWMTDMYLPGYARLVDVNCDANVKQLARWIEGCD